MRTLNVQTCTCHLYYDVYLIILIMIYYDKKVNHNGPEETTYIEQGVG